MTDFGVDHYCKPNSVTSTSNTNITAASPSQQRKKLNYRRGSTQWFRVQNKIILIKIPMDGHRHLPILL